MAPETIHRFKRTAKLIKKFYKPELTLMQVQHEIVHSIGFKNWSDFLNTSFTDDYLNKLLNSYLFNRRITCANQ